jgi:hypothetical protein
MKTLITFLLLGLAHVIIAQPGPASIDPASIIKDTVNRTVTMKNGEMKNTAINSFWQLHGSGFQPMISLGAGSFYLTNNENADLSVVTLNAGNILTASMMAPVDLPHDADIVSFEACYQDQSLTTNMPDCGIKFSLYRVVDNACPPELIGAVLSEGSGGAPAVCPVKCSAITFPFANLLLNVSNKKYFYYILATSLDVNGANGVINCGNWETAKLGVRGVSVEYKQK